MLCLHTHICTYHQKQDIKKTKRLLFKYVSPFLHENPCFHKCEGRLFYKTFFARHYPRRTNSAPPQDQWDLSEAGLQWTGLAFGEIIKLGIANFAYKWNSWSCFTRRQKAHLLSLKASVRDCVLNMEQCLRGWETHLLQCLKIMKKTVTTLQSSVRISVNVLFKTFNHVNAIRPDSVFGGKRFRVVG